MVNKNVRGHVRTVRKLCSRCVALLLCSAALVDWVLLWCWFGLERRGFEGVGWGKMCCFGVALLCCFGEQDSKTVEEG